MVVVKNPLRTFIRIRYLNTMAEDQKFILKEKKRVTVQDALRNSINCEEHEITEEEELGILESDLELIENLINSLENGPPTSDDFF